MDILKSTLRKEQRRRTRQSTSASGRRHPRSAGASCCPSSGGWSPSRARSPATPRSAATCGSPTRSGSRIPATRRSCSARRSTTEITSNDPIRNPYETVLERLRRELKLTPAQVATIASWDVFNAIAEHTEGATQSTPATSRWPSRAPTPRCSTSCRRRPGRHGTTRGSTRSPSAWPWPTWNRRGRASSTCLQRHRRLGARGPLRSAARRLRASDRWLEQLWTWLQAQPDYRGRTHVLITTDHGRGHDADGWRHHGEKYPDAERVWMAFVSPKMAQRGEWRGGPPLSTNQIAATLASWVGVDWNTDHPGAGKPIRCALGPAAAKTARGSTSRPAPVRRTPPAPAWRRRIRTSRTGPRRT